MKLTEIFDKLLGMDAKKDYNFTVSEVAPETTKQVNSTVETGGNTTTTKPPEETKPAGNTTADVDSDSIIAAYKEKIKNLEQTNAALLRQTPVQDSSLSIDENILNVCLSQKERSRYGLDRTSNQQESAGRADISNRQ